jgi:type IV pilus assembly protein PilO
MSRKMRLMLSAVALVAIVALAWFMLISPLRAEIATTDTSISAEQTRLAAAQAKLAQAETTRAEGKKNQARLIELAKMVPVANEVPSLLVQIQDLADQAGIQFISLSPGEPKDAGGFQIIPLTLTFSGSYFDLSDFAYRAEQLVAAPGRLLTVKSIQLSLGGSPGSGETVAAKSSSPELTISMTLYAFSMDQSTAGTASASQQGATQQAAASAGESTTTTAPAK